MEAEICSVDDDFERTAGFMGEEAEGEKVARERRVRGQEAVAVGVNSHLAFSQSAPVSAGAQASSAVARQAESWVMGGAELTHSPRARP